MFCQKCGAQAPDQSAFCRECGNKLKGGSVISNKAMILAALAAVISVGTAFLPYGSSETKSQGERIEMASNPAPSPSPEASPVTTPTPIIKVIKVKDEPQAVKTIQASLKTAPQLSEKQIREMIAAQIAAIKSRPQPPQTRALAPPKSAPKPAPTPKPKAKPAPEVKPTPAPPPAPDQEIYPMTPDCRPAILYREKAKYTELARLKKVQGTIVLQVVFALNGQIEDIRVIRGLPYGLTYMAIDAAQKIKFKPAIKNGQPVAVRGSLEFTYNLH